MVTTVTVSSVTMKSDKYSIILLRTRKSAFSSLKLLQATKHTTMLQE